MYTARPVVGVDIDGVIARITEPVLEVVNKRLGTSYTDDDWTDYYGECFGAAELITECMSNPKTYRHLGVYQGAVSALHKIGEKAHLWLLTSRPPSLEKVTRQWLAENQIPFDELDFTVNKHLWAQAYLLDAFIEDKLEAAELLTRYVPLSVLIDRPWNRGTTKELQHIEDGRLVRTHSWEETVEVVLEHLR